MPHQHRKPGPPVARTAPETGSPASHPHNADAAAAHRSRSDQTREEMLAHIQHRLDQVRTLVAREAIAVGSARHNALAILDVTRPDTTRPDPTRWHGAARAYLRAAEAAAAGDLINAARRLREATTLEDDAWRHTSSLVDASGLHSDTRHPWTQRVPRAPAAGVVVPQAIRAAVEDILTHHETTRPLHGRILKPAGRPAPDQEQDEPDDS